VVYALQSGQFPAISPGDLIYRGLSLHGFWLINWIRNAPRTEIEEIYQKLGDLVADGSLSAAVEQVYPLDQFKEAFRQSLKSNRSGKILFQFGATDVATISNNQKQQQRSLVEDRPFGSSSQSDNCERRGIHEQA
jgi:hypothetical protein